MRRGYHLVPKHIFGVPTDVFGHGGPRLPYRLKLKFFGGLVRLLVGDLRRYGLQRPDHPIMASHPIMNTQLVHHLQHGEVTARPDIEHLNGDTVRFVDGSSERFDIIVWATGYETNIPFLAPRHLPFRDGVPDLFLRLMHRDYPDLFVAGLYEIDASVNPTLSLQGKLVAAALRASCGSPPVTKHCVRSSAPSRSFAAGCAISIPNAIRSISRRRRTHGRRIERSSSWQASLGPRNAQPPRICAR